MTKLVWDQILDRRFDSGLDRGVFYPLNGPGYAWNGLISVEESPSEADSKTRYLDGVKIGNRNRRGEFIANVEAFTYPPTFLSSTITSLRRTYFGLSYRIKTNQGYQIHLVYNALATLSERQRQQNEITTFSWLLSSRGVLVPKASAVAHLVIDSAQAYSSTISALEDLLYGAEGSSAQMPSPTEVLDVFEENSILRIIDNGDGTWTAIGADDIVMMTGATTFAIDYKTAVYIDANTYTIHSL